MTELRLAVWLVYAGLALGLAAMAAGRSQGDRLAARLGAAAALVAGFVGLAGLGLVYVVVGAAIVGLAIRAAGPLAPDRAPPARPLAGLALAAAALSAMLVLTLAGVITPI